MHSELLFVAGALQIQARAAYTLLDTAIQPYADRQESQIIAHVTRDGRLQPGAFKEIRQTIDVETEEVQTAEGKRQAIHSGIRLSTYSPHADPEDNFNLIRSMPLLHYGDRIRLSAKLRRREISKSRRFRLPRLSCRSQHRGIGPVKMEDVERLPGFSGSRLHRGIIAKVHELWPPREAALIDAMVME